MLLVSRKFKNKIQNYTIEVFKIEDLIFFCCYSRFHIPYFMFRSQKNQNQKFYHIHSHFSLKICLEDKYFSILTFRHHTSIKSLNNNCPKPITFVCVSPCFTSLNSLSHSTQNKPEKFKIKAIKVKMFTNFYIVPDAATHQYLLKNFRLFLCGAPHQYDFFFWFHKA